MKKAIFVIALLLGGCGSGGVDWFPSTTSSNAGNPTAADTFANISGSKIFFTDVAGAHIVQTTLVGTYTGSSRQGPEDYIVATSKGVFSTYTSLDVPHLSATGLDQYKSSPTGPAIRMALRSADKMIFIRAILMQTP